MGSGQTGFTTVHGGGSDSFHRLVTCGLEGCIPVTPTVSRLLLIFTFIHVCGQCSELLHVLGTRAVVSTCSAHLGPGRKDEPVREAGCA